MNDGRIERWQEFDCPTDGIDYDLTGDDMLDASESFECPVCEETHNASSVQLAEYEKCPGEDARIVPVGTWKSAR